jgi:GTP-binding protein HflX
LKQVRISRAEKALLVGARLKHGPRDQAEADYSMEEAERLLNSAGAEVVGREFQQVSHPSPKYFIGEGKAMELMERLSGRNVDMVVFDTELAPAQQRNLEDLFGVKVLDRTGLILDIFAQRAKTREGKLQVELAQLNYLLPRLSGKGVMLSRLGGGIGTRGPGETKLEYDKRGIKEKIRRLREELDNVRKTRSIHRKYRKKSFFPTVSIVGYTNSGKSTLLNRISGAGVAAEDRLFSTLDPTTRSVRLPGGTRALFSDTVGFIKSLPHQLVEAFRATLEEVMEADAMIHVVDASNPEAESQMEAVDKVLGELGVLEKRTIYALNKIDKNVDIGNVFAMTGKLGGAIAVSALEGDGIPALLAEVENQLVRTSMMTLRIAASDGKTIAEVKRFGRVLKETYDGELVIIDAEMQDWSVAMFEEHRVR